MPLPAMWNTTEYAPLTRLYTWRMALKTLSGVTSRRPDFSSASANTLRITSTSQLELMILCDFSKSSFFSSKKFTTLPLWAAAMP